MGFGVVACGGHGRVVYEGGSDIGGFVECYTGEAISNLKLFAANSTVPRHLGKHVRISLRMPSLHSLFSMIRPLLVLLAIAPQR